MPGGNGDQFHNLWNTWFLDIQMIQQHGDLWLWEHILRDRAEGGHPVRAIIELGSGNGALSLYLALQARQRTARFWTLDHFVTGAAATPVGQLLDLASRCITGDMWSAEIQGRLQALLADPANHPLLLLCDGGNKPKEFQTFLPALQPEDVIAVHDWSNEFGDGDIPANQAGRITMLRPDESEQMQALTRWWVVTVGA